MAEFHIKGSPPRNHLPCSLSISVYHKKQKLAKSNRTYLEILTFLQIEVSHDELVHAEVKGQFGCVQDLILDEEGTGVGALQEFTRLNRRLHRVVEGVVHRRGEVSEVVLKDKAESLLQELLRVALFLFTTLH